MPSLLPHDWEMTPRYRILDSAMHRGNAGQWQLHLVKQPSWNYSFLWMRPLDVESDAGYIALDARFNRERIFGAKETLQSLDRQIGQIIGNTSLARRFILNTRGELRRGNQRAHEILTVTRDGVASWSKSGDGEGTAFRWRAENEALSGAEFIALPALRLWAELRDLLANPNGEAAFAREFARLNPEQRRARIQRPARGTLEELNALLRDILLASPQWDDLARTSNCIFRLNRPTTFGCGRLGAAAIQSKSKRPPKCARRCAGPGLVSSRSTPPSPITVA